MLEKLVNNTIKTVHATQGINYVEVNHVPMTHQVPVTLRYRNAQGNRVVVKNTDLAFMRSIGLAV